MHDQKSKALSGKNNKRINNTDTRNSEITFPLVDAQKVNPAAGTSTPSIEDVIHAKDWIDNGSRL